MTDPNETTLFAGRRRWLALGTSAVMMAVLAACGGDDDGVILDPGRKPFPLVETSVAQFHDAMSKGQVSCRDIVQGYLNRIAAYDKDASAAFPSSPALRSVILANPNALAEADALDRRYFGSGRLAGPLHCVPVIVKDNVDTVDVPTTAGSLVMAANQPPDDAYIVKNIKAKGAIIIAKANLDEFAFGFGGASALGGRVANAYIPANSPGGSSSGTGTAVAASFAMIGVGTDTGGSVRVPSAVEGLFGIRPTLRLVSQDGIVPLAHSQDTAGPMCRAVADCALLLDAMVGYDASPFSGQRTAKAFDAPLVANAAEYAAVAKVPASYTAELKADGLKGARIGVVRAMFPAATASNQAFLDTLEAALAKMREAGAIVEDVTIEDNRAVIGAVSAPIEGNPGSFASLSAYEFTADLTAYLSSWASTTDNHLRSTQAVAAALATYPAEAVVLRSFQSYLANDAAMADTSTAAYRTWQRNLKPRDAYVIPRVQAALDNVDFSTGTAKGTAYDVLVYPVLQGFNGASVNSGSNNRLSPFSGFPAMAFPAGFAKATAAATVAEPVAFEMLGREFAEGTLIRLGHAWEMAARPRVAPPTTPEL
ncbi:amidase family protein [Aquincola tertiaricarbonis]|uniref:amidase family protein n=1 Tax=Aquincola tertiaricarbonis TaxID=391953 RepID=UPI000696C2EF|nr:amidase family protein [Aquincola tertiaricarbonis]